MIRLPPITHPLPNIPDHIFLSPTCSQDKQLLEPSPPNHLPQCLYREIHRSMYSPDLGATYSPTEIIFLFCQLCKPFQSRPQLAASSPPSDSTPRHHSSSHGPQGDRHEHLCHYRVPLDVSNLPYRLAATTVHPQLPGLFSPKFLYSGSILERMSCRISLPQ